MMATKKDSLFFKDKQKSFLSDNSSTDNDNHQFSNLNLNQNFKCSDILSSSLTVHSYSKSNNDNKNLDYAVDREATAELWNIDNSLKTSSEYSKQYAEAEKQLHRWRNKNNPLNAVQNINNSTLSLHIAAYENSVEDGDGGDTVSVDKNVEKETGYSNPFDISKLQRKKNEAEKPEISEFHASEKLYNPNELIPPTESTIIQESFADRDLMNAEFYQKASKILDLLSPHFTTIVSFEKIFHTLSLHITAYENSVENGDGGDTVSVDKNVEKDSGYSNSFDISKLQRKKNETEKPEISEFHASKKLFNPNKLIPPTKSTIIQESFADRNLINPEFYQKASKILDLLSPHFTTIVSFEKIFQNFYGIEIDAILKDYCCSFDMKKKFYASFPNIKIEYFGRGIFISSNVKPAENGSERMLSIYEAMELLRNDKKESNTSVADLKKKFYQR
uniref:Uncharacterized protein n=1 Tax=Panagrolaimus sp. ES5 TaxID=591445 RepID=A0AC34FC77_9BILA